MALATVGLVEPPDVKLLWIRNTLRVEEVECGEAFLPLVRGRSDLQILTEPRELEFDVNGMLCQLSAISGQQSANCGAPC